MKRYRIFIDPKEGVKLKANSIVEHPAHEKVQHAFSKQHPKAITVKLNCDKSKSVKFESDDVKQNIVGVAISPDLPIYRNDDKMGEYEVVFSAQDIETMAYQDDWKNNLDFNHNNTDKAKTASCYLSYIIDSKNKMTAPELFKGEPEGTLILGYHFESKEEYEFARDNFGGFSIDGDFYLEEIKFNTSNMKLAKGKFETISAISKWDLDIDQSTIENGTALTTTWVDNDGTDHVQKVSSGEYTTSDGRRLLVDSDGIVRMIFKSKKQNMENKKKGAIAAFIKSVQDFAKSLTEDETFGSATLTDGTIISWEGDLVVGVAITVQDTGEPAPDGEHTFEDGTVVNVSGGVVESIVPASTEEMEDESENELAEAFSNMLKLNETLFERLKASEKANTDLRTEFEAFKKESAKPEKQKFAKTTELKAATQRLLSSAKK